MDLIVDSSVWIAVSLRSDTFHLQAQEFFGEFRQGRHVCHLSRIVLIEVLAAIYRRTERMDLVLQAQEEFKLWGQLELVKWYDLDEEHTKQAIEVASTYRLKGADAAISLGNEQEFPLFTFDRELLERHPRARLP